MNEQDKIVREAIIDSLVKLRMVHVWEKNWYKKEDVREYISVYYGKIRNIIQTANRRYWELTRCADCGIYFNKSSANVKEEKTPAAGEKTGSFIGHVRFIISLIEGQFISWQEIKEILLEYFKKWRQHPLEYWLKLCNMTA